MGNGSDKATMRAGGFLTRLAHDVRGNTIAIMAMALIPLAGMVGGGIDLSRMYILKTRMQHACDAGALAGRKTMSSGTWAATNANAEAVEFFDANFLAGSFGSYSLTKAFTENAGKVTGNISAKLPMTIMKIFKEGDATIAVTCDAEMRLPNTDVMFVLDTTGSMAGTKIAGLKTAVKCFYEIVAKLDTDASCTTGTPSGGTGTEVQIRFGFVPYSMNVNVGKLLPSGWFADYGDYQSREARWDMPGTTRTLPTYYEVYGSAISQSDCQQYIRNKDFGSFSATSTTSSDSNASYVSTWPNDGDATAGDEWGYSGAPKTSGTTRTCRRQRSDVATYKKKIFRDWSYDQVSIDLRGLKNGTGWNNSVTLPLGDNGADRTVQWDGCIEERQTERHDDTYWPIPTNAYDLNIDMAPTSDVKTQWKPALSSILYLRAMPSMGSSDRAKGTQDQSYSTDNYAYAQGVTYACPTEAKKLQAWPSANDFDDYVDSLAVGGNTYHDIGMIWGARFMSPTGLFKADNALTPKGGEIERHMIFMTDGDSTSNPCDYNGYGVPWWDRRESTDVGLAKNCTSGRPELVDQTNLRLEALCNAVKNNLKVTLWVVSYGGGSSATTEARLKACATDASHYFLSSNPAKLQSDFQKIANQISMLRLTN